MCMQHGIIRERVNENRDDILPERAHSIAFSKCPKAGVCYSNEGFLRNHTELYHNRGCNEEGTAIDEHLKGLGLEFIIAETRKA